MLPYFPRPSILVDRRRKSGVEMPPNCPRCDSSNTKFCYYNNYSLSQPRYFCKGCRRYWTKGGSLRNVPVGGGCRKNRPAKAGRMSADRAAESNYGCRRLQQAAASMRPDLLLDDPAASSCCPGGIGAVSPAGESRPGGADIDLALLYTKILNQCSEFEEFPAPEVPLEVEEPFDLAGVVDADQFVDVHLESQHRGPDLLHRPALSDMMSETQFSSGEHLPSAGDSSFYLDPSFCLPQTLPAAGFLGGDMFWSSCATAPVGLSWQQAQSPGMGTVEEEHLQPQPNPFINSWNTFSFSSCEAFPKT